MINKKYYTGYEEHYTINKRYFSFSVADEPDPEHDIDAIMDENMIRENCRYINLTYNMLQKRQNYKLNSHSFFTNKGLAFQPQD